MMVDEINWFAYSLILVVTLNVLRVVNMVDLQKICNQISWIIILFFVGFPVAVFCAGWYIMLVPLTVCCVPLKVRLHLYFYING